MPITDITCTESISGPTMSLALEAFQSFAKSEGSRKGLPHLKAISLYNKELGLERSSILSSVRLRCSMISAAQLQNIAARVSFTGLSVDALRFCMHLVTKLSR